MRTSNNEQTKAAVQLKQQQQAAAPAKQQAQQQPPSRPASAAANIKQQQQQQKQQPADPQPQAKQAPAKPQDTKPATKPEAGKPGKQQQQQAPTASSRPTSAAPAAAAVATTTPAAKPNTQQQPAKQSQAQQQPSRPTSAAKPTKQQQGQQQPSAAAKPTPIIAAENPHAPTYVGALVTYNPKTHHKNVREEVRSPQYHPDEASTLHKDDLPPLPRREGTEVEAVLETLSSRNREPRVRGQQRQARRALRAAAAKRAAALPAPNMAGPAPAKPIVPKFAYSYSRAALHIPIAPACALLPQSEEYTAYSYIALGNAVLNAARARAEAKHRRRFRARVARLQDTHEWTDLTHTLHLRTLHSADAPYWDWDLRTTFFVREANRGLRAWARGRERDDPKAYALGRTFLVRAHRTDTQGRRPKNNVGPQAEMYLLNSFLNPLKA